MEWVLCLGHALLGAALLPFAFAPEETRRRAIEVASVLGVGLGAALVVAGEAGSLTWRTAAFEPHSAAPAGFAAAAAWLVTGALAGRRPRAEDPTLIGVAASGLVLAATGRYVVPALLFWLCSSAALALHGRSGARWAWVVLAVSDACVCVAALAYVWDHDTWAAGQAAGAIALAALAAGAMVRGGGHPGAPWAALERTTPAAAPLFAAGAIALAARASTPDPWAALALVTAALAVAGLGVRNGRAGPRLMAAWLTSLALAVCFVSPTLVPVAGVVAVVGVTGAALWPFTAGRGGAARALMVSAVPLTAGFGMVAAGATDAFGRATAGGDALPWTIVGVLLPAALAAGAVLGARAARSDAREFVPEAILATWLLLGLVVAVALFPLAVGDSAPLGDGGGVLALQAAALVAGIAAGVAARRAGVAIEPAYGALVADEAMPDPALPRPLSFAAPALWVATAAATGWLTVAGLRVGFL